MDSTELPAAALAWLADDPDPATQAELAAILAGWPGTADDLADRFAGPLRFGTAGLRGPMRAGPNGMNLAVVRAAAAGLAAWLADQGAEGPVVIGHDARHNSAAFAEQTARVLTGAGRAALLLPGQLPTPVLAYAVRALAACAGVMVTASHNPPADNGYKVYLGGGLGSPGGTGAQLAPPVDTEIEAAIRSVGPLAAVPLGPPGSRLGPKIIQGYLAGATAVLDAPGPGAPEGRPPGVPESGSPKAHADEPPEAPPARRAAARRALRIGYTPLHGVGAGIFTQALERAGFSPPAVVAEQVSPDPDFPTVVFPNPEEPGAMDRVLDLAARVGADLAIAHDPDADRCAVAVPTRPEADPSPGSETDPSGADRSSGWRLLTGDELGVLLADELLRRGVRGRFVTTIVSSSLLGVVCAAREVPFKATLTGFKWIVRGGADPGSGADRLVFGYEEALGYCVAPELVRDKDGITAGLLVAELAAELKAAGRTLLDRLDELATEFGVYATGQLSIRVTDLAEITRAMAALRAGPPTELLGEPVTALEDRLPSADVVTLRTTRARVVVRPSGTEPKLKAYLEVVEPTAGAAEVVPQARQRAQSQLSALRAETAAALGVPIDDRAHP